MSTDLPQNHWFHGIEHLTKSGNGYVSWRGQTVEHYSFRDEEAERRAAEKLAQTCRTLESKNFPVNGRTAINAAIFCAAPADTPWLAPMLKYYSFMKDTSGKSAWCILHLDEGAVAVRKVNGELEARYAAETEFESGAYILYHQLQREGFIPFNDEIKTYEDVAKALEETGVPPDQYIDVIALTVPAPKETAAPAP